MDAATGAGDVTPLLTEFRGSSEDSLSVLEEPPPQPNDPASYLKGRERSAFLRQIADRYIQAQDPILEIGCGVGRNLDALFHAGYDDLSGIEINPDSVQLFKASFPDTAALTTLYNAPAEEILPLLPSDEYEFVFTMAFLEHLHPDSEGTFAEIVRVSRAILVTIENESWTYWRSFPRDYRTIFEGLGMREAEKTNGARIHGFNTHYMTRTFIKRGPRSPRS